MNDITVGELVRILRAIPQGMETSTKDTTRALALLEEIKHALQRGNDSIVHNTAGLSDKLRVLDARQSTLQESIDRLVEKNECLERASQERERLSVEWWDHHVYQPLARGLITFLNDIRQIIRRSRGSESVALDVLVYEHVKDRLFLLGFEVQECVVGDRFDPAWMQPVGIIRASERSRDMTVAAVLQPSVHKNGWRIPCKVRIYKFALESCSGEEGV